MVVVVCHFLLIASHISPSIFPEEVSQLLRAISIQEICKQRCISSFKGRISRKMELSSISGPEIFVGVQLIRPGYLCRRCEESSGLKYHSVLYMLISGMTRSCEYVSCLALSANSLSRKAFQRGILAIVIYSVFRGRRYRWLSFIRNYFPLHSLFFFVFFTRSLSSPLFSSLF